MDVEKGSRIVQILDDAGLQVKVALWAFSIGLRRLELRPFFREV